MRQIDNPRKRTTSTTIWRRVMSCAAALVTMAATSTLAPESTTAAAATYKDSRYYCAAGPYRSCLQSRILKYNGKVWGAAYYAGPSPSAAVPVTILVYQCNVHGNCGGPITASRPRILTDTWEATSTKDLSPGHVYRACASGASVVNLCTPTMAWNA
jgi:hypothetical protein